MNFWTPEESDQLQKLWLEGFSGAQIGEKLGKTRNAVIGKAHRLGLPQHIKANCGGPGRQRSGGPGRPRKVRKLQTNGRHKAVKYIPFWEPVPKVIDELIPLEQRKSLLELGDHDCRWPVGEVGKEGFFFCGSPTANLYEDEPYCPAHSVRALAPEWKQRRGRAFTDFHLFGGASRKAGRLLNQSIEPLHETPPPSPALSE